MDKITIEQALEKQQQFFELVVPFDRSKDKLLSLDLTEANTEITEDMMEDVSHFTHHINEKLAQAGARYAVGGYGEHRTIYARSPVFDARNGSKEPRRFHLGTDIWGKPYTAVKSPMDGIVHSFAFNNAFGDYGPTIILSHKLENCTIHTLYGHLSLNSLKNIHEGQHIEKGEIFAEFGISMENGHWPPHLHFQLIIDMLHYNGDYPGVCSPGEKEKYLQNSPDPELVLQLKKHIISDKR